MDLLKKNEDTCSATNSSNFTCTDGCVSRITCTSELGKFTNFKALFSAVLTVFRKIILMET